MSLELASIIFVPSLCNWARRQTPSPPCSTPAITNNYISGYMHICVCVWMYGLCNIVIAQRAPGLGDQPLFTHWWKWCTTELRPLPRHGKSSRGAAIKASRLVTASRAGSRIPSACAFLYMTWREPVVYSAPYWACPQRLLCQTPPASWTIFLGSVMPLKHLEPRYGKARGMPTCAGD